MNASDKYIDASEIIYVKYCKHLFGVTNSMPNADKKIDKYKTCFITKLFNKG